MINSQMKEYDFFTYQNELNEYGEEVLSTIPKGKVKMAINLQSQSISDNTLYKEAEYIGLTYNKEITDATAIAYTETEILKVLFVNPFGRLNQVYLKKVD